MKSNRMLTFHTIRKSENFFIKMFLFYSGIKPLLTCGMFCRLFEVICTHVACISVRLVFDILLVISLLLPLLQSITMLLLLTRKQSVNAKNIFLFSVHWKQNIKRKLIFFLILAKPCMKDFLIYFPFVAGIEIDRIKFTTV